jgi:hypothetical protein
MSEAQLPFFQLVVAPGTTKQIDFGEHPICICALIKAARTDPKQTGKVTVKVEVSDVESGAENPDTADIVVKKFDLVDFAAGEAGPKDIQFQCVVQSGAKFTVEGDGSVTLSGAFIGEDDEEEEEEEEAAEEEQAEEQAKN